MEYLRYIEDGSSPEHVRPGPDSNALTREISLLGQAFDGFTDAARSSLATEHIGETAIKVGLNASLAVGLGLMAKGGSMGGMAAKTFAGSMTIAFGSDVLLHSGEMGQALADNWHSSEHWDRNAQVMRNNGGAFLFDTALMTATGFGAGRIAQVHGLKSAVEPNASTARSSDAGSNHLLLNELVFGAERPHLDFALRSLSVAEPVAITTRTDAGRFNPMRAPQAEPQQLEILRKVYPKLFEPQFATRVSETVAAVLEQPIWQENLVPKIEKFARVARFEQHFAEKIAAGESTPARVAALEKYGLQRAELASELKGIINGRTQTLNTALEPLFYNQQLPPFEFKAQFMASEGAASASSYTFEVNPLLLANRKHSAALFHTMMHEYMHINQNYLIARKAATDLGTTAGSPADADRVAERVGVMTGRGMMFGTEVFRSAANAHSIAEPLTPVQSYIATRLADGHGQYPYTPRIGYLENRGRHLQQSIDLLEENAGQRASEKLVKALSTPDVWLNIFNQQRGGTTLSYALFERKVPEAIENMKFSWLAAPKDAAGRIDLTRASNWDGEANRQLLLQTFRAARDQVATTYARASRSYYDNVLERQAHQTTFLMPLPQLPPSVNASDYLAINGSTAPTTTQRRFWRGEDPPLSTEFNNTFWNSVTDHADSGMARTMFPRF